MVHSSSLAQSEQYMLESVQELDVTVFVTDVVVVVLLPIYLKRMELLEFIGSLSIFKEFKSPFTISSTITLLLCIKMKF